MIPTRIPRWSRRQFIQTTSAILTLSSDGVWHRLQAETSTQPTSKPVPDRDHLGGEVAFEGDPPERGKLDMRLDPFCSKLFRKSPLLSEELIVDEHGGLANVFVAITGGLPDRKWPVPKTPAVLTERCHFIPHVLGVQAGQTLKIVNDSVGQEAPHLRGRKNPPLSFILPKKGTSRDVILKEMEVVPVTCDIHPWESAWCHVVNHPYFAVSDEKGRFSISTKDLEPGRYELTFWHEKLGTQTCNLQRSDEAPPERVKITYTMPDRRHRGREERTSK